MNRAEAYKERLNALGSMFEFDVAETQRDDFWHPDWLRSDLTVRAVLRFKDTELTLVYSTQDTNRLGPEVLLEIFADGVKHALVNPKAHCYMPAAPLTYTLKEAT